MLNNEKCPEEYTPTNVDFEEINEFIGKYIVAEKEGKMTTDLSYELNKHQKNLENFSPLFESSNSVKEQLLYKIEKLSNEK